MIYFLFALFLKVEEYDDRSEDDDDADSSTSSYLYDGILPNSYFTPLKTTTTKCEGLSDL